MSSFRSQYGIRLSTELKEMKWDEFKDLLIGIAPDTALGRIVQVRAEDDKDIIKHFSKEQHRIRNEWKKKKAKEIKEEDMNQVIAGFEKMFREMAGVT
ncbi:MAG: Gp15 family bacteriophage protein [Lachnospiraceae bacterium]